jgi:hypothetical protein
MGRIAAASGTRRPINTKYTAAKVLTLFDMLTEAKHLLVWQKTLRGVYPEGRRAQGDIRIETYAALC